MSGEDQDKVIPSNELIRLSKLWQEVQELRQKLRHAEERLTKDAAAEIAQRTKPGAAKDK